MVSISVRGVVKEFKRKAKGQSRLRSALFPKEEVIRAVDGVSMEIRKGEIFGLLGPNGAGKTTMIKMLCGLLQPTSGTILLNGSPVEKNCRHIGLMLGGTMVYDRITGYDNLEYIARIYGVEGYPEKIREITEFLGLEDSIDDLVEVYSTGMKTKLALARILVYDPDIILLDEPTLGLDPNISMHLREKVLELKKRDKTIILATHYMDEADYLCDRIGLMSKGRLVRVNTPSNLKKQAGKADASLSDVFIELAGGQR